MSSRALALSALAVAAVALLCAGCGGDSGDSTSTEAAAALAPLSTLGTLEPAPAPGTPGGELVAIPDAPEPAPAASQATASHDVEGIKCEHNAKLVFHAHPHVTVFVNGKQRTTPAGVGIAPPVGPDNYRASA